MLTVFAAFALVSMERDIPPVLRRYQLISALLVVCNRTSNTSNWHLTNALSTLCASVWTSTSYHGWQPRSWPGPTPRSTTKTLRQTMKKPDMRFVKVAHTLLLWKTKHHFVSLLGMPTVAQHIHIQCFSNNLAEIQSVKPF